MTTTTYKNRTRYQTATTGCRRNALDIHANYGVAFQGEPDDLTRGVYFQFGPTYGTFSVAQAREAAAALNALADEIEADVQRKEAERIPDEPKGFGLIMVLFDGMVPAYRQWNSGPWKFVASDITYTWLELVKQVKRAKGHSNFTVIFGEQ